MKSKGHTEGYEDIINLPHPASKKHPRMSMRDRAAQFSPFAALTGHDDAIRETARLTDSLRDLDESYRSGLDEKLRILISRRHEHPQTVITYFLKDEKKAGGSYAVSEGRIRNVDWYERVIIFDDRTRISIDQIVDIDSEVFCEFERID